MKPLPALRRWSALFLVSLVLATLAACAPRAAGSSSSSPAPEDDEGLGGGEPAALRAGGVEPRPLLAAFDPEGALVLIDPTDGALVDRRELAHLGDHPADLVLDVERARILLVLEAEGGEGDAAIVAVPFDGESLGAATKLAGTLGHARLAVLREGIVLASDGDGPRVRLLRHDGEPTPGRALDPVRTWWAEGARVEGLALGRGVEAVRFALQVDANGGIEVAERRPIGIAPEEATLVITEAGEEVVVLRGADGAIDLSMIDPSSGRAGEPLRRLAALPGRLDAAAAWPAGHVALAIAKPAALVIASLQGEEEIALPLATSTPSGAYGQASLAVVLDRLFVGTKAGLVAFRADGEGPIEILPARDFDGSGLRGPLIAVPGVR